MPRFNFNNITLQSNADISKVMENFNKIENNAVLLSDLVTTLANGLMSKEDKIKLNGIANNANNYTLPTAGKNIKGGVQTNSNVNDSTGYTACPIIGGIPYYKGVASYNDLTDKPIINCGNLSISDNNLPDIQSGSFCLISSLTVNGIQDNVFNSSIAIFVRTGDNPSTAIAYLRLLVSDSMSVNNYSIYDYNYVNGVWTLSSIKRKIINYGTEDLEAGVSELADGEFYFVYEE